MTNTADKGGEIWLGRILPLAPLNLALDGLSDHIQPRFGLGQDGINPVQHVGWQRQGNALLEFFLASHAGSNGMLGYFGQSSPFSYV